MNEEYSVKSIGRIHADEQGFRVVIDEPYRAALKGLEDFGCVQLLWWFSGCDNDKCRNLLVEAQPYTKGARRIRHPLAAAPEPARAHNGVCQLCR